MKRLPIRARLTAAFALGMVLVLGAAALFTYVRVGNDLDEGVDTSLRSRADAVTALARRSGIATTSPRGRSLPADEEGFIQILGAGGRVLTTTGEDRRPALRPEELARARAGPLVVERRVAEVEGVARILARPLPDVAGATVLAVGQSLDDRDETLSGLLATFAVGGPLAILLASAIGYALAATGLAPVEAMRRRAAGISLTGDHERLPLPDAQDEIRRLGETLNHMLERLRTAYHRERRFVADASHELRTPVAVVKTELEGALLTGDYGPQVREALVAAVEECDHLAQLAEDLLIIARSAEGKLPVRREALEVRDVLDGVRNRFVDRARERGRRIRVEAPPGLVVHADALRLRQAVGNLVDNALRHGEGEIVLSARGSEGGVAFDTSDQGPGFEPAIAPRAFERFTRGDHSRTRGGTGLGMAIVEAVALAHGGRAAIVDGVSTVVRLWLPDDDAAPPRLIAVSAAAPTVSTDSKLEGIT